MSVADTSHGNSVKYPLGPNVGPVVSSNVIPHVYGGMADTVIILWDCVWNQFRDSVDSSRTQTIGSALAMHLKYRFLPKEKAYLQCHTFRVAVSRLL